MGAWGDRIGRRRVLLIGAAGYGAASLLATHAHSIEVLISARAFMGVAGATLMPSTLALAAALVPHPRQRATAIAVIIASVSGGTAIGPLVGGWLLDRFWWGSAFLLAVPVMAVLLILVPILVPEHRGTGNQPLDILSAFLSVAAVLPVVYGIKQIAVEGPSGAAVLAIFTGLALAVAFTLRQRKLAEPFIDLTLFRNRTFSTAGATLALGIFVLWGSNYAIAQYLQLVVGLSPLTAGLWTAPSAVGVIALSTLAPKLARRFRPTSVIAAGLMLSAVGYAVLTQVGGDHSLAIVVTGAVIASAGLGPMMALSTDLMIGSAPPERAGAAAAISSTTPQLGGAFGIAVLGSIITATYRSKVQGTAPADTPPSAITMFEENLSAASIAADHLPQPLATQLLALARDAYTAGLQLAAATSIVIVTATASFIVLVARPNRRESLSAEERPDEMFVC
jgi:DHA2 family multidrug resistance protein-like MFS transporter